MPRYTLFLRVYIPDTPSSIPIDFQISNQILSLDILPCSDF